MYNEPSSGEPRRHPMERTPGAASTTPTPSNPIPAVPPTPARRPHPLERAPQSRYAVPIVPGVAQTRVAIRFVAERPTITYVLIALNVALFIIRALSPTLDASIFDAGADNARLVLQGHQIYRLLSSMFLHAGIYNEIGQFEFQNSMHLVLNMYVLYAVGTRLERVLGHARFIVIYLFGGLTASLFSILVNGPTVYSVGASGAVFAILAAEFVYFYQNRHLYGRIATAQMRSLAWLAVINLGFGFLTSAYGAGMSIDNWAHLGGLIGGLAVTWLIGATATPRLSEDHTTVTIGASGESLRLRAHYILIYCIALMVVLIIGTLWMR